MHERAKTTLLVEDDPNDVELTLEALAEYRVANEVVVLHDGAEALDYLCRRGPFEGRASGSPAVVLLDLKMPNVDGLTVLRTIKANPALNTIPIKPVDFVQFVEAVRRLGYFWAVLNERSPP